MNDYLFVALSVSAKF